MRAPDGCPPLEVNSGPERPHRSPVPRYEATDQSFIILLAEVEKSVAIIAVDPEVTAGKDLEPAAGVPAELSGCQIRVARAVDQLHLPAVPTRAAQQEWRHLGAAHPQEQRCLNRRLGDLLVEEFERF